MKYFLLAMYIFTAIPSYADETKRNAINLIMDKAGIERQIAQIPQQLMQSIQQRAANSSSNNSNTIFISLAESIQFAYKIDKMKKEISDTLYENLTSEEVIDILKWFASSTGQKITEAEVLAGEKSTTPAGMADISAFIEHLNMSPPTDKRLKMIKYLDNSIRITDFMVDTALNTGQAFMKAMQKTIPNSQLGNNSTAIEKEIEKQRAALKPIFKQLAEKTLLYTYKDINYDELSSYLKFYNSSSGKKFSKISFDSIGETLTKANNEMANYFSNKIN